MNLLRKINWLCTAMMCLLLVVGCSDDETASSTGKTGYIQLRLFPKGANTRSEGLDYMADAKKIELSLLYGDMPVTQTLNLNAVSGASEFGLTSEKLELRTGEYKLLGYTLYSDVKPGAEEPEKLLSGYPEEEVRFNVNNGHITEVELDIKATVRGNIYFELLKDLSNFQDAADNANSTRAIEIPEENFNYDDIVEVDLYYHKKGTNERPTPHSFKVYRNAREKYFHTDTTNWEAGEYEISRYMLYKDEKRTEMILAGDLADTYVTVEPNVFTKSEVEVKYPDNIKSIKDYIALYNIWIATQGPTEWSYNSESFPVGSNWRFKDRPVDEWGNQPGVSLNANGRVKAIDLGSFNPVGDIPAALGDLTEIESLWLGTHDDVNAVEGNKYSISSYELYRSGVDMKAMRMEIAKERLRLKYPKSSSKIYEENKKPFQYAHTTYDFQQGSIANRIKSIPKEIGKLEKLTYLFIANGYVSELPEELGDLPELTDLEFYNCRFTEFPKALYKLQKPISLNFSNNSTIPADQLTEGLNEFFRSEGASNNLQLFYLVSCGLTDFPDNMRYVKKIGLIDMANNKIKSLPDLERRIAPVQAIFDNNKITTISDSFCNTNDIETFSASNNLLTEFPNLFGNGTGASNKYVAETVDLGYNYITHFKEGFLGLRVNTLTLSGNKFGERKGGTIKGRRTFPDDLSRTNSKVEYLMINHCEIDSLPPSAFKNLKNLAALDASENYLRYIPSEFNVESLPYLTGLNLSINSFKYFPTEVLYVQSLNKLYLADQMEIVKNANGEMIKEIRCLQSWPQNLENHFALRLLDVSGNDIRKIAEIDFPTQLASFNVSNNPNLDMTIPSLICQYIASGMFQLGFDSNQYIQGCPILDLDNN